QAARGRPLRPAHPRRRGAPRQAGDQRPRFRRTARRVIRAEERPCERPEAELIDVAGPLGYRIAYPSSPGRSGAEDRTESDRVNPGRGRITRPWRTWQRGSATSVPDREEVVKVVRAPFHLNPL